MKLSFSKLLLTSLHPRSSKETSGKFQEIWVWLDNDGHTQLKVLVTIFGNHFYVKNLTDESIPSRGIDDQRVLQSNSMRAT